MVYIERDIEKNIESWLESKEIIIVRGPRQSGKTTLLRRIEDKLKAENKEKIHFISFEDNLVRLKFEENPKEFIEFYISSGGKHYFLLDEVQYVKEVGQKLKLVFDSFSNVKLILTGSSSFDLTNMGSYLVGRAVFFNLYPFSFSEFLRAKSEKYAQLHNKIKIDISKKNAIEKTLFLDDLNKLLHEYLTYGSYPRVVLEKDKNKKKELLANLFTTYIEKDIVLLYGIKCRENVIKLLKAVAAAYGNAVKYETLSVNSGLKYNDVREILPLLKDSFVISVIPPYYNNLSNELRKNPKIYFADYGLRNHLLENFENVDFDAMYENFVSNELSRSYKVRYWRTTAKTEVDFVIEHKSEIIPIEVKTHPKLTYSFRSFINHYRPSKAFMLCLNDISKTKIDSCDVYTVPFVYI